MYDQYINIYGMSSPNVSLEKISLIYIETYHVHLYVDL